jgi:1,4-alpha-glucan branching enzyme
MNQTEIKPSVSFIPSIHPVMFHIFAPGAHQVEVAGTFSGWSPVELEADKDGTWSATLQLQAGFHDYKFIIDGQWTPAMGSDRTLGGKAELKSDGFGASNRRIRVG